MGREATDMSAEILTIGTELLLGQTIDTNAAYVAEQLAAAGIDVYWKTTVGDNKGRIGEALRQALGTKVRIARKGAGGTIEVEFYSLEDLDRIYERICGRG